MVSDVTALPHALVLALCALGCSSSSSKSPPDAPTCALQSSPTPSPPGPALTSRAARGAGACFGWTLGDIIDTILGARPELADVSLVFDPGGPVLLGDRSYIYPFALPDGGFALILRRGGGDCPAGCTENEYWYFQTDASCAPKQIGHYHPTYPSGGRCVTVDGAAMWGTPAAPDPKFVCAADLTAQDISGTFTLCAQGTRMVCSDKAGAEREKPVPGALTLTIAQRAGDRSKGTVTLAGTGHPLLDGVPLDATFERRRFTAKVDYNNLPSACANQYQIEVRYDFEGVVVPGHVHLFEVMTLACPATNYCKGQLDADIVVR